MNSHPLNFVFCYDHFKSPAKTFYHQDEEEGGERVSLLNSMGTGEGGGMGSIHKDRK